jgi:hypothetical protein
VAVAAAHKARGQELAVVEVLAVAEVVAEPTVQLLLRELLTLVAAVAGLQEVAKVPLAVLALSS